MQKHVNLVDLVKSFPTNILLQNLASIQKRTSPLKFYHLAENQSKVRYRIFQLRSASAAAPKTKLKGFSFGGSSKGKKGDAFQEWKRAKPEKPADSATYACGWAGWVGGRGGRKGTVT